MPRRCFVVLLLGLNLPLALAAEVSFTQQVVPVLVEQCLECHRADKAKGGYRLDTWRELQKAGDSEVPPVVPGEAERSELWRLIVTHEENDRMPKKGDPLPAAQVAMLREWIADGAVFDGNEADWDRPLAELVPEEKSVAAPARYPHPLPVVALAAEPGGGRVAVGGYREVTLWQGEKPSLVARWGGLPERVLALAWVQSDQGHNALLVAGGEPGRSGGLWWIDAATDGAKTRRLLRTRDCLMAVAVSPDGKRVVAAGADQAVHCVELPAGRVAWSVEAHADWVLDLAMSPDGKQVVTGSRDRSARVIDLASGEIDATFPGHGAPVSSVLFEGDGQTIVSADAGGEIRRWKREGEAIKDGVLRAGRSEVTGLAWAGTLLLATLADGRLLPLDLATRKAGEPLLVSADRLPCLHVVPDTGGGWQVWVGGHDGKVHRVPLTSPHVPAEAKKPVSPAPTPAPPLQFVASPGWSAP